MFSVLIFIQFANFAFGTCKPVAKCIISNGTVYGEIKIYALENGRKFKIKGDIYGLKEGKHGFHIHEGNRLGNNCMDAKGHFNPDNKKHGAPGDEESHIGDLGNIESPGRNRPSKVRIESTAIRTVSGYSASAEDQKYNIIDRTIVVHADEDDFGMGGFPDSKTTGHAGARLGCCIIELVTTS